MNIIQPSKEWTLEERICIVDLLTKTIKEQILKKGYPVTEQVIEYLEAIEHVLTAEAGFLEANKKKLLAMILVEITSVQGE